ncbi:hypothetical protein EGW08_011034 [Elysia chlorotica]|uniref:PKD domain-containing protein n=1 Tax=Elysia chlorotica TaxID=188477 RepID=A0A3S0ZRU5_ELYCH|nr:hypothetical protein EGW08_011034 [Elysia chlorotica]
MIEKTLQLSIFVCVFHIIIFSAKVGSEVLSFNGKYFNNIHPSLPSRPINFHENADSSLRLNRLHARSTSSGKSPSRSDRSSPPKDAKIAANKFQFINTENAERVYVNTLGENSTQKIFILMVSFEFDLGWSQVKESVLWCSEDNGESFHVRNLSPDAKIHNMVTFPSNPLKMILLDSGNRKIYTTEDGLVHNSSHSVPVEPSLLIPHPSDENKLLMYSYQEQKLYGSDNFAANWTLVAENVMTPIFWGDSDFDTSEDVVHMQIIGEIPSQAFYKACLLPGCQQVPDLQDLERVGAFTSGTLMVHKEFMFVQKENQIGSESHLMVSYKRGLFKRAQFPSNDITSNFLILNLDDHQVFLAVHHGNTVNLYLSDVTGQYYVLSLPDVFHDEKLDWFEIDFTKVKGMDWTFMANKIVKHDSQTPSFVQTYVSYDKGGNWAPLFINKSCSKVESCSLLLELKDTFEVDAVRSSESAPGIILGHGILGQGHEFQETSIFVTNDGGATWEKAPFNTTCFLRILNHGGLLSAIPDESSSKTVYYSLDQGKSWQSEQIDEDGMSIIDSSAIEKTNDALVLNVLGKESKNKSWIYLKLNMKPLLPNNCDDKDYETWSPKDYNAGASTQDCILGKVVEYKRRKPGSECKINKISFSHVVNNSSCVCTKEDYECDFGFEKADDGCRKSAWLDSSFVPLECDEGGNYNQSQGYRKIPADVCTEDEVDKKKYDRKEAACPSAAPNGLSLTTEMRTIPLGKKVIFTLEQARGSKWDTKYTWDFGDKSETVSVTGFQKASQEQHTFQNSGTFNVTVTAENKKGTAKAFFEVHALDRLTKLRILAPWALVIDQDVKISVLPMSSYLVFPSSLDNIHFLWSFGDEEPNSRPLLSWNSSMTHSYAKTGTYKITIEASNSISSVSEEFEVRIFESAMILQLQLESMSSILLMKHYMVLSFLDESIREMLAQDLGLNKDRLEAVSVNQSLAYLYLFPTQRALELSVSEIRDKVIDQANKGLLGFDLFGASHLRPNDLIKIVSAREISGPHSPKDKSSRPNLTPVYVAVPVLVVVLISLAVIGFVVYRRKRSSSTRYSLFESQDESDTMLDDEDVAPLNMNLEIGAGASTMDDSLIDSDRHCLVMESGGRLGGNEEVC